MSEPKLASYRWIQAQLIFWPWALARFGNTKSATSSILFYFLNTVKKVFKKQKLIQSQDVCIFGPKCGRTYHQS